MDEELEALITHSVNDSAVTDSVVNNRVQTCRRHLHDVHRFRREKRNVLNTLRIMPPEQIRERETQQFPPPNNPSRLQTLSDSDVADQARLSWEWLLDILESHRRILDRIHIKRILISALAKQVNDRENDWSDLQKLYMTLTNHTVMSTEDRLQSTFVLVLHYNYAESLADIGNLAAARLERIQDAEKPTEEELYKTYEMIAGKALLLKVDHFACAVPLSMLTQSADSSIFDDNAGCCPICQHSYTDLSSFKVDVLLADYPVRLKYCGHIVGRGCLEQWMNTPKINEDRYPHRTCPLCRAKIEDVPAPPMSQKLDRHLSINACSQKSLVELFNKYDLEVIDVRKVILACISMAIACDELLVEVHRQKDNGDVMSCDESEKCLKERQEEVKKEMRTWGFRRNAAWKDIRNEWMNSGVIRKE